MCLPLGYNNQKDGLDPTARKNSASTWRVAIWHGSFLKRFSFSLSLSVTGNGLSVASNHEIRRNKMGKRAERKDICCRDRPSTCARLFCWREEEGNTMFIFFELIGFQLFFFFLSSSARSISLKAHTNKVKLCEITRRNGGRSKSSSQPDFGNNHQREFAGRNKKRSKKMRLGRNRLQIWVENRSPFRNGTVWQREFRATRVHYSCPSTKKKQLLLLLLLCRNYKMDTFDTNLGVEAQCVCV